MLFKKKLTLETSGSNIQMEVHDRIYHDNETWTIDLIKGGQKPLYDVIVIRSRTGLIRNIGFMEFLHLLGENKIKFIARKSNLE